ncbi:hypothetical protein COCNU_scaffold017705G000020 [Cocos nucifera]|nr:hypothetical protein [Cocos nucifera]
MGANGRVNMVQKEMPVLMLLGLCYLVFTHGVKDRPTQVIRCALHERDREDGQIGLIGMEDKPAHKHSVKVVKFAQIRMLRGKYYGSIADLNVYGISPISVNQHSATAIWIVNDGDGIRPLEIIIVGWIVHPQLYGDTHTRFFTYWNHAVGSQNGGCFDLLCSGFVQVSSTISLGGILSPLSDYDGHQYVIRILIFKDPSTENWWLLMGKDVMPVGYWPKSLFNSLSGHANKIYWGGAVFTPKNERSPPMGDGCFIEYGPACFIAKLKLVGKRNRYRDISDDERHYYQNKPMCYDIGYFEKRKDGRYFPFGGPGGC